MRFYKNTNDSSSLLNNLETLIFFFKVNLLSQITTFPSWKNQHVPFIFSSSDSFVKMHSTKFKTRIHRYSLGFEKNKTQRPKDISDTLCCLHFLYETKKRKDKKKGLRGILISRVRSSGVRMKKFDDGGEVEGWWTWYWNWEVAIIKRKAFFVNINWRFFVYIIYYNPKKCKGNIKIGLNWIKTMNIKESF